MKKIITIFFVLAALAPLLAKADALGSDFLDQSVGNVGLSSDLERSAADVISTVLVVTGTMFLILTVVAGVMWMTASGNEDKITKAKKILIGAVIGLVVILSAYTITAFVGGRLTGNAGSSYSGEKSMNCLGDCKPVTECTADVGVVDTDSYCGDGSVCCMPN